MNEKNTPEQFQITLATRVTHSYVEDNLPNFFIN